MSTAVAKTFRKNASAIATQMLAGEDPEKVQKAANKVSRAFYKAVAGARNPQTWANLRPESVAEAVANSVDTDLYPGGPMPQVYLVPQSGALEWRITHRGLTELCRREGYAVRAVPVHRDDHLRVSFGEVTEHEADPRRSPSSLDELLGVIVVVRKVSEAHSEKLWMSIDDIERRRQTSRMGNKGPWKDWPVEMAMKTAILYHAARGSLPTSSSLQRAVDAEYVKVESEPVTRSQPRALPMHDDPQPESGGEDQVLDPEVIDDEQGAA